MGPALSNGSDRRRRRRANTPSRRRASPRSGRPPRRRRRSGWDRAARARARCRAPGRSSPTCARTSGEMVCRGTPQGTRSTGRPARGRAPRTRCPPHARRGASRCSHGIAVPLGRVSYAMGPMSNERRPRPLALAADRQGGSPGFAAVLSALLPGLGQMYSDRWVKGILMVLLPVFVLSLAGAFVAYADALTAFVLRNASLVTLGVVGGLLLYHLYVVADAFADRMNHLRPRHALDYLVLAAVTIALIAGYGTLYRQSVPWASLTTRIFAPLVRQQATTGGTVDDPGPGWTGSERLNVLILGIDTREGDRSTQNTDTMIVLSLDPLNKTASMLSLPRDIYINKPGMFQGKINSAFAFGGPSLVRSVVNDLLGIRLHSYALVTRHQRLQPRAASAGGPRRAPREAVAAGHAANYPRTHGRRGHDDRDRLRPGQRAAPGADRIGHRQREHRERRAVSLRRRLSALRAEVQRRGRILPPARPAAGTRPRGEPLLRPAGPPGERAHRDPEHRRPGGDGEGRGRSARGARVRDQRRDRRHGDAIGDRAAEREQALHRGSAAPAARRAADRDRRRFGWA